MIIAKHAIKAVTNAINVKKIIIFCPMEVPVKIIATPQNANNPTFSVSRILSRIANHAKLVDKNAFNVGPDFIIIPEITIAMLNVLIVNS